MEAATPPEGTRQTDVLGTPTTEGATPPEGTTQTDTPGVRTTETDVQPNVPEADNAPNKEQVQPGQPSKVAQDSGDRDPYYCPGCGRGFLVPLECTGRPEAGHPPIQTVPTDELDGDPDKHTAAPATE